MVPAEVLVRWMCVLSLAGCGVTVTPTCALTEEPLVGLDSHNLGWSGSDVTDLLDVEYVVDGMGPSDVPAEVTVRMSRVDGDLVMVRSEPDSVRRYDGSLLGVNTALMAVHCVDSVKMPVRVEIDGEDLHFAQTRTASIKLDPFTEQVSVQVRATLAWDHPALPNFDDVITDPIGQPQEAFVDATIFDTGTRGAVGWRGQDERSSWTDFLLRWRQVETSVSE